MPTLKHTRVENWLNQSQQDDLDEKESSIDSFQSLNEDIRTLRDENHKVCVIVEMLQY